MLKLILLLLFLLAVGIALSFYYYGVFAGLGAMVVAFVIAIKLIPKMIGRGIQKFAIGMFESKSKVLRGATAEVHSVEVVEKPERDFDDEYDDDDEPDDDDEEACGPLRYVAVDATVKPKPSGGPFMNWHPYEMALVPCDTPAVDLSNLEALGETSEAENSASVYEVTVLTADGQPMPEDYDPAEDADDTSGDLRVKFVFAVPEAGGSAWKFRYYFEDFGRIELPA